MIETKYVLSASIIIKIVPNVESNFRIVVAAKPNQKKYNQKIVLNCLPGTSKYFVDSYSYNFLLLVGDEYL